MWKVMNTWNKDLLNSLVEESKVMYVAEKPTPDIM
jgi:hypothetical protein